MEPWVALLPPCLLLFIPFLKHGARAPTYAPADFVGEFGTMVQAIQNDSNVQNKTNLIGPSVLQLVARAGL